MGKKMLFIDCRQLLRIVVVLSSSILLCSAFDETTTNSIVTDTNTPPLNGVGKDNSTTTVEDVTLKSPDVDISTTPKSLTENASMINDASSTDSSERISSLPPTTSRNSKEIDKLADLASTTVQPEVTTSDLLRKWRGFENITKIFAKDVVKVLLPLLMEGGDKMNISDTCQKDVLKFLIGFRDVRAWAFSFIDASAKVVDGMLGGTLSSLGEYDQCLDIKATNDRRGKNFGQVMFTGKYCAIDLRPPIPPKKRYYKLNDVPEELEEFSKGGSIASETAKAAQFFHFLAMRLGVCVPSGCSPSDLQQVVDIVAAPIHWTVNVTRCEMKQENEYTPLIIGVMTAMSAFGFLLVIGSLIDLYHRYAQKKINNGALEVLVSFSLPINFKKLIHTKQDKGPMSCLHGFRFLSISWIILGHTYLNVNYLIFRGLRNGLEFQKEFFFQAVVNASVAVDTFFFIGGLLVCYVTVKVIRETKKPFSIGLYIMHRFFRLLPVYVMVIAFIYLAPITGSGPIFRDAIDPFLESCYKNWWTNLIFLNNFLNTDHICLPQSWYVACDMQLYIAALIVILPILRWPWVGLSVASLGVVASILGTMAMTYIYEYPPTMLFIHPDIEQRLSYWANAYFKPYSHAGPYCIGLIIGYVLATHPKLKFSPATRIIGWAVAVACNMSVLYGVYEWNIGRDPNLIETLLYSGLHRVVWTFGIAWVVLNCAAGQGGVVNYILSWRVWIPLGRLTYTIYLIHPIVQIAALANIRMNVMTAHYFAVWIYFGHLMITIGAAFAASMLVEAPFIQLEKIFLRLLSGKPPVTHTYTNGHAVVSGNSTEPKRINSEEGPISANTRHINGKALTEPISHL